MLAFSWITQLVTAVFITVHDYTWLLTDPTAHYALIEANCTIPTPSCLRTAKVVHRQVIQEQLDHYWCTVNEEIAKVEHEKQVKDDHDRYIAQQLAKGDKWDRWEVSPPTINVHNHQHQHLHQTLNNFINPTLIAPTFISTCTAPPKIPGLDVKLLAAKYRPTATAELADVDAAFTKAQLKALLVVTILLGLIILILIRILRFFISLLPPLSKPEASGPPPRPSPPPPTPKNPTPRHYVTPKTSPWPPRASRYSSVKDSPLPASKLGDAISAVTVEDPVSPPPAAQVDNAPRELYSDVSPPLSSPLSPQALERPLEPSMGIDTEPAPSLPATAPSPAVEDEDEDEDKMQNILLDMLDEWDAEASESPLESSTGNIDISAPPVEPETAPSAAAEGGQPKRKILPLRKRRAAAPQPAAPKLGSDEAK